MGFYQKTAVLLLTGSILVLLWNVRSVVQNHSDLRSRSDLRAKSDLRTKSDLRAKFDLRAIFQHDNCGFPRTPCTYNEEVDLRIIVTTYNRHKSLLKVLEKLQDLKLDGSTAVVNIWIDRSKKDNSINADTLQVARNFKWKLGPSRVYIHKQHVGLYGQ